MVTEAIRGSEQMRHRIFLFLGVLGVSVGLLACGGQDSPDTDGDNLRPDQEDSFWANQPRDTVPNHPAWTGTDLQVFQETVAWARGEGLADAPIGEAMVRLGTHFLGTRYTPQTLEVEGNERLVINFRELDCVTFVETVLALNHFLRDAAALDPAVDPGPAMDRYEEILTRIRYRDGRISGYPSRSHYFLDWIRNNERDGLVQDITGDLGGVEDGEPINFMSTHPDSYRQLGEQTAFEAIIRMEEEVNAQTRIYLPQVDIQLREAGIQDGDIIAATSTVDGLDVAHTGIALWRDGRVFLMHAPLVGEDVQISEVPLADRIAGIRTQDGILVVRPLELI